VDIVRPKLSTVVYGRRGGLLAEIGPAMRSWVRIVELPAYVGQAFVATEDRRFYHHDGVDVIGLVGAIRDNLFRGLGSRGASAITEQLIGAMYPATVVWWSGSARGPNRHRVPRPPACCAACAAGWSAGGRPGRRR